jgi:hypothetical protein
VDWQQQQVAMQSAAEEMKDRALEAVALIGTVKTPEHHQEVITGLAGISEVLTMAEKARKEAKAPYIDMGRKIDAAHDAFIEELRSEQLRIGKLDADYIQLEQAKARAAEAARRAEERKLEEERREREREAQEKAEAEQRRIAEQKAEIERQLQEARSEAKRIELEQAQRELERQQALAQAQSHEELDAINDQHNRAVAELPIHQMPRAKGQRVVDDWDIRVTDINMLYKSHPGCVKMEPRLSEIKALLRAGKSVIGIEAKPKINVSATATRAIDV